MKGHASFAIRSIPSMILTPIAWQTYAMVNSVGADQIEGTLFLPSSTLPDRMPGIIDYFYGDPRELVSIAQSNLVQLRTYCRTSANANSSACQNSGLPFPLGFPNYFQPLDIGVQLLGLYGLSGDVTVSTVDRRPASETTGQVIQTSLISNSNSRAGRPAVQYCSALSKTLYDVQYPEFIDYYKAHMNSISAQCPTQASSAHLRVQKQV